MVVIPQVEKNKLMCYNNTRNCSLTAPSEFKGTSNTSFAVYFTTITVKCTGNLELGYLNHSLNGSDGVPKLAKELGHTREHARGLRQYEPDHIP